jgi:hypothetical protein
MSTRFQPLMLSAAVLLDVSLGGCDKGLLSKHSEPRLTLSQLPMPVKPTLDRQSAGANVTDIERRTQGSKVVYRASITRNGVEQRVAIAEDGILLGTVKDDEDEDDDD